ncbi:MAG: vitamin K epoxide reductase family protein, partial [Pseudomonadota bacterium]
LMHGAWRLAYNGSRLSDAPSVSSWGPPIFALFGLGIGIYLTSVAFTHSEAMCGPIGDCMRVQASPHSKLFGVPMAIWGMLFYLGILGLWLLQRRLSGSWRLRSILGLLVLSLFGVIFSIYLTGLELFVIHAVCIWCLSSAVLATLIMLIVTRKVTTAN